MNLDVQSALETPALATSRRMPIPIAERRLLLIGLDLVALTAGLVLALVYRPDIQFTWGLLWSNPRWVLLLSFLWLFLAFTFDAYDPKTLTKLGDSALAVIKAGALASGLFYLIPFLAPVLPPSRSSLFVAFLLPVGFVLTGRALYALLHARTVFQRRILIIGAGWAGQTISEALAEAADSSFRVLGVIDDDTLKHHKPLRANGTEARALEVLGGRESLKPLIRQHQINTLVLAITHQLEGELLQSLMECLELGVEIVPMPELYEQLTGRVPIEHVGDNWYVAMPIQHPGTGALYPLVNRVFDILSASAGMVFLGLAFPFLALAIYLDSPGPIFYRQERVGKGGRRFWVYKFRSMIPDAENGQAVWAQKNDSRVTRVGRLLRKTHIDEFPQFINILKGDMSAVGPRPERPEFIAELAEEIPFYRVRHAVKPGMAGWGLVRQGYGASKEDAIIKLQYDLYYIKHQSLWLDVIILLKTVLDTVTFGGR